MKIRHIIDFVFGLLAFVDLIGLLLFLFLALLLPMPTCLDFLRCFDFLAFFDLALPGVAVILYWIAYRILLVKKQDMIPVKLMIAIVISGFLAGSAFFKTPNVVDDRPWYPSLDFYPEISFWLISFLLVFIVLVLSRRRFLRKE